MKTNMPDQIVAKLRKADVGLGKGLMRLKWQQGWRKSTPRAGDTPESGSQLSDSFHT